MSTCNPVIYSDFVIYSEIKQHQGSISTSNGIATHDILKSSSNQEIKIKDRLQIPLLILGEFKLINKLLFPLKSLQTFVCFADHFKGNRS